MEKDASNSTGVIEGASRVFRELLKSPRFKKTITIILNEFDPENAPLLIHVLREEDPELFLSLLSFSPALINAQIEICAELLKNFTSFPPSLLSDFLNQIFIEINAERAGEAAALLRVLAVRAIRNSDTSHVNSLANKKDEFIKGYTKCLQDFPNDRDTDLEEAWDWLFAKLNNMASKIGKNAAADDSNASRTVCKIADNIRAFTDSNPDFIEYVLRPLMGAISGSKNERSANDKGRLDE